MQSPWRRIHNLSVLISAIGARGAVDYINFRCFGPWFEAARTIFPRPALHPLRVRFGSSDLQVFRQIYVEREYACLDDLSNVGLIIDCGANVGYSSAYFLSRFANSKVIAIEPDPGNFAALRRNLSGYGDRVKMVYAGVWSRSVGLVISKEKFRDGAEWTRQVRPCIPGEEAEFQGVDIGTLLAESHHDRISILKIDVEGAEAVIFRENFRSWLDKVDNIAIELHGVTTFGNTNDVFFSAIKGQGFEISRSGELTICRRKSPVQEV